MALPDTYSRRKRLSRAAADPLRYDQIPVPLRVQIIGVFSDALDRHVRLHSSATEDSYWTYITDFFRRELGVFGLAKGYDREEEFKNWFLTSGNIDHVLDATEMMCRTVERIFAKEAWDYEQEKFRGSIIEINARLMEAGIGFQFESDQIIQADSKIMHAEVTVPALQLLSAIEYRAANEEFLSAHAAFKDGEYEDALTDCAKAFESVLKIIAAEKGWGVAETATAKVLLDAAFKNNLIPAFLQAEFTGLRTILESGVPTVRNKNSAHGAGTKPRKIPRHLAAFQLHQTAAAILFLIEAAEV